jgi:hypothetical protein
MNAWRAWARRLTVAAVAAALSLVVIPFGASPAQAYCIIGVTTWSGNNYDWAHSPDYPTTWWPILNNSVLKWSDIPGSYLHYNGTNVTANWRNFGFRSARYDFSNSGLENWPGFTSNFKGTGTHSWTGVDFNLDWTFNSSGTMNQNTQNVDLATVAVHEIGHASGVAHPFEYQSPCGTTGTAAEIASVMNPNFTTKRNLTPDDVDAMQVRY